MSLAGRGAAARRGLQMFLTLLGTVALGAGITTTLFGVKSIPGQYPALATVDSELRFYAVWYAGAGILLLHAVPRIESSSTTIRAIAALLFVAGSSRLLSWLVVGRPHSLALVLMTIELALPFVVVPWQAAVARATVRDYGTQP